MELFLAVLAQLLAMQGAGFHEDHAQVAPPSVAIELLAAPRGRPDQPLAAVEEMWSIHDFEDSVVVRARVSGISQPIQGAVIGQVRYKGGRRVGVPDNPEVMDPDLTAEGATWLPSASSFHAALSDATVLDDGELILVVGYFKPLTDQQLYLRSDSALVFTDVRIDLQLVRQGGEPYGPSDHTSVELMIGW